MSLTPQQTALEPPRKPVRAKPALTPLRKALADKNLLGTALQGDSWAGWRALLLAAMGERLDPVELDHFKRLTHRSASPDSRVEEAWIVAGRRAGKSRAIAALMTYLACLCDHRAKLVAGEKGVVVCLAPSQLQASIVLGYISGILEASPILKQLVARQTSEQIELTNGITIDVRSASFRRIRGLTAVAAVLDECAFFYSDEGGANTDVEILGALRPALGTTAGLLMVISSPYSRRGILWDSYRRNFGAQGDPRILVAHGDTRALNPSYPQAKIDREYERDPAYAAAEFGGQFRTDIESFIAIEAVQACTDSGVRERPYDRKYSYVGFVDPSGGSNDSMTMAIAHREGKSSVLDAIREVRPPFAPAGVVEEFAKLLKSYRVHVVRGDRYAGEWVTDAFREHGIGYEPAERTKSEIYGDLLPLINGRLAGLLEHDRLQRQLVGLERRVARSGKDSIDHGPGGHDDVANAVAGVLTLAEKKGSSDPDFDRELSNHRAYAAWDKSIV